MRAPRRDDLADHLVRDTLTNSVRQVLLIALLIGSPYIFISWFYLQAEDAVVRWGYPPLFVVLVLYGLIMYRRPRSVVPVSRVVLVGVELGWLGGMLIKLRAAPEVHEAWDSLFPTTFLGFVVFIVVGFIVGTARQAVVNAAAIVLGVLVLGFIGLGIPGGSEYARDLIRYASYLGFISGLLHVLSRAKINLTRADLAWQEASSEVTDLRDMAYLDPLTGLANRRRLVEELTYQSTLVSEDHQVAVIYLDLDHFKDVNDRHGHATGDAVLCWVGEVAGRTVRRNDLVARLGGEEFVIVTAGTGPDRALQLAERLRRVLPDELESATGVRVTASFGVVSLRADETAEMVLDRVDKLMYAAKGEGRDRVAVDG